MKDKGWTSVEHYHVRNGKCTADNEYGVQGVPHVLLVDKEGMIVFMGHPASRNIEKDIDALLAGEKLTGEGTGASAGGDDDKEGAGGKDITAEIEAFKSGTKDWVSGIKEKASKLGRAFLVLTNDRTISMKDLSMKDSATVHTVLMGNEKEAVGEVLAECKKFS